MKRITINIKRAADYDTYVRLARAWAREHGIVCGRGPVSAYIRHLLDEAARKEKPC